MNIRQQLAIGLALVISSLSSSCVDRQLERDLYEPRIRCAPVTADIQLPGQASFWLINSQTGTNYEPWCTCTTHEQWLGEDEAFNQWVSEMSYETCLAFVEREGYNPAHSTCQADYEAGVWQSFIGIAEHGFHEEPKYCEVYTESSGCSVE